MPDKQGFHLLSHGGFVCTTEHKFGESERYLEAALKGQGWMSSNIPEESDARFADFRKQPHYKRLLENIRKQRGFFFPALYGQGTGDLPHKSHLFNYGRTRSAILNKHKALSDDKIKGNNGDIRKTVTAKLSRRFPIGKKPSHRGNPLPCALWRVYS